VAHVMTYFTLLAQLFASSDYYDPLSAVDLLNGLRGLDDESAAVTVKLWAMDAEVELSVN
jgi:hypothetical protein